MSNGFKIFGAISSEKIANSTLSLPVHEFITTEQIKFTASKIRDFYKGTKY